MEKRSSYTSKAVAIIGSRRFFLGAVLLLALQAAWIALSGRYPMAFDEDFHLGLIKLYSHHLSPFLAGQPPGADVFGAVARDPSYLYHYLMSFPYRLIGLFMHGQYGQIIALRVINIGLFAWGLFIFRRLLLKTEASSAMVNTCLAVFVLIPVVPQLAAQINYDNLLFPLTALALLWTVELGSSMSKRYVDARLLLRLSVLCLLTSLVKYAFLPIFLAILIYLAAVLARRFPSLRAACSGIIAGLRSAGRRTLAIGSTVFIISLLMFGQRYGVNVARYHTPVPPCHEVLSRQHCSAYGPWLRDYRYGHAQHNVSKNPAIYTGSWLYGMWLRLFFAVDGNATRFQTRGPLVLPGMSAIAFTGLGIVLTVLYGRRIFHRYDPGPLSLFVMAAILYVGALWLNEFMAYVNTGQPVAINGRYLFPVLPPLILIGGLSAAEFLRSWKIPWIKPALAASAVICLLWGGGALTYILRSNDAWYWPGSPLRSANHAVRDVLGPVTPGYRHPVQFLH